MSAAEPYVRFFKSGDSMGIETNATTAEGFYAIAAETLGAIIDSGEYAHDWEFQLSFWLPQVAAIAGRLAGVDLPDPTYKKPTSETVLRIGYTDPEHTHYVRAKQP